MNIHFTETVTCKWHYLKHILLYITGAIIAAKRITGYGIRNIILKCDHKTPL